MHPRTGICLTEYVKRCAVPAAVAAAGVLLAGPASAVPTASDASFGQGSKDAVETMLDARVAHTALDPVGTTRSPGKAVSRLMQMADNKVGGYWGQCQRLADDAYMPRGPRVGTANEQWARAKKAGLAHVKDAYPPLGAQMFWHTDNPAGHVATYVGDGKVVTNMSDGGVKAIRWERLNEWGPYLGWAPPFYKEIHKSSGPSSQR